VVREPPGDRPPRPDHPTGRATDPTTRAADPTNVTAQPALTRSTGRRWLVWGAVLGAICVVLFALLVSVEPRAAITGGVLVVVLYAAMVVVRVAVRPRRARLLTLACLMGAMAVTAVVVLVTIGVLARLSV